MDWLFHGVQMTSDGRTGIRKQKTIVGFDDDDVRIANVVQVQIPLSPEVTLTLIG